MAAGASWNLDRTHTLMLTPGDRPLMVTAVVTHSARVILAGAWSKCQGQEPHSMAGLPGVDVLTTHIYADFDR